MGSLRSSFVYAKVRTRSLPTNVRDAIFQNCVFQLSSILEDYIGELASQWFSRLVSAGATNSALPEHTRALFAARIQEEAFRRFIGLGDEVDLAERTTEQAKAFTLFDDARVIEPLDFRSKLVKDRKFPSVDNVNAMFRRLGMPKIFRLLARRTKSDAEFALRGFMDVRNALAHESPPSITDVDVNRYFGQVGSWIEAIDREFYRHVVHVSGSSHWR